MHVCVKLKKGAYMIKQKLGENKGELLVKNKELKGIFPTLIESYKLSLLVGLSEYSSMFL